MSWIPWLNEEVDTPYGGTPRRTMLHMFIKDGLYPFIESCGYTWATDVPGVQSALATGLYLNQSKHHLESNWATIPIYNSEFRAEDLDQYYLSIDASQWDAFWDIWGHWTDVATDTTNGLDRRQDIERFVWGQLNIVMSRQTLTTDVLFEDDDYQDDSDTRRRRDDIYLREAADSNEWGGYRR